MDGPTLFQKLLDLNKLNPTSLAGKLGRATLQSGYQRFLEGKVKEPRRNSLQPAAEHFGVDVGAFYSPELADTEWARVAGLPVADRDATSNISSGPTARGPYPLISEVQAGEWTELCDHFAPGDAEDWLPSTKNLGHCGYMLRVSGKSMENPGGRHSFMEGVILHVNPDLDPTPGQFVIVRREATKEATFKRYTLIDGDAYLEAINPEWPKDKKYLKLQPGDVWCGVVVDASFGNLP